MKRSLLRVMKEIGILLLMFVILAGVAVLAFYKQVPFGKEIPKGEEYVEADDKQYSVSSTDRLQNINSITITHETNSNQIVQAENDVRIETGKPTPFGSIAGTTDLPSERVGSSVVINNNSGDRNNSNNSSSSGDTLQYPSTAIDDAENTIKEIKDSENESAGSLLDRRVNGTTKSGDVK